MAFETGDSHVLITLSSLPPSLSQPTNKAYSQACNDVLFPPPSLLFTEITQTYFIELSVPSLPAALGESQEFTSVKKNMRLPMAIISHPQWTLAYNIP